MIIRGKNVEFPIYLPDATRGVVRNLDTNDLQALNIQAVVVNSTHLIEKPGAEILKRFQGIKNFMNFKGLVVSDSGGWQIFSLIHRQNQKGEITDAGIKFSIGTNIGKLFTPETSIDIQIKIGSDIIICLDDFTPPDATDTKIKETVDRTILWAKKCKDRFLQHFSWEDTNRPLLFAVIQGGWNKEMRKYCAQKLIEIDFDGYGFGGYVINKETKKLDLEMAEYVANLIPNDKIKFALGTGTSHDIAMCSSFGWQIFDCTLPTRDARHKRLYTYSYEPKSQKDLKDPNLYTFKYIKNSQINADDKICNVCDCFTCKNYSISYLTHLFNIKENLGLRLATIHNLRHYTMLTEFIKKYG